MKKFRFSQSISANELILHGIETEFDLTNSKMKLSISDKNIEIFRCDLVEEDYPMDYPDTISILEIVLENPMFSIDQKIDIFSTIQSEHLIFWLFRV
jgi:hypothetical protein